jgi:CRISPR/Cas system CSM-associated protein Csm3 (group 7 of RAMP superfamily)
MGSFEKIKITYEFAPASGLKIGAGHGKHGTIDNAFRTRKTADNKTIYSIPGTSVKGRVRSALKKLAHILHLEDGNADEMIFGKSGKPGWAHFSDLKPKHEKVLLGTQTNTSIDRFRKAAKHQSLRMEEYIALEENESFQGEIEGYREVQSNRKDVYALLFALYTTTHFGADKTSGFGKGEISIKEVLINGESVPLANLKNDIIANLGE